MTLIRCHRFHPIPDFDNFGPEILKWLTFVAMAFICLILRFIMVMYSIQEYLVKHRRSAHESDGNTDLPIQEINGEPNAILTSSGEMLKSMASP